MTLLSILASKMNKRVQTIKFPQMVLCKLDNSYNAREQKRLCVLTFRVFRRRRYPGNLLMPLPSLQVRRGSECSHFFTTSKCVRVQIPRMMLFNYLRALCWASYRKSVKYKVKMVVQRNGKPTILTVECDKICPAGKSGGCCPVIVVIWKMNEMSRNKKVQPTDNRSCTSKLRKLGISGKRIVQHKPS